MNQWFRMEVASEDAAVADVYVFDIIGGWIDDMYRSLGWDFGVTTAKSFLEELSKLPDSVKTIRLHINSPGGDVFSAAAIANTLRDQKASKGRTVTVLIEGLAASAASILAMAGDTIQMADNALMMIHLPWTWAVGDVKDFAKVIGELEKITNTGIAAYQWHSPLSTEEIRALLDAETWMDADEAIAQGFATEKVSGLAAAAALPAQSVKRSKLQVPERYRARLAAIVKAEDDDEPVEPDADGNCPDGYEKGEDGMCRLASSGDSASARKQTAPAAAAAAPAAVVEAVAAAGLPAALAGELIRAQATPVQVTDRVATEQRTRAEAETRTKEIRALCGAAKLPRLADGLIRSAMSLADVRGHLAAIRVSSDGGEIDGTVDLTLPAVAESWKSAFARARRSGVAQTK